MADPRRSGLFQGSLAGDSSPRRLSLASVADNLLPAAASCGLNAVGGAIASALDTKIDEWKPGAGTLGIALVAVGIKTVIQPVNEGMVLVREIASGMAGWVGDELFDSVRLWWKSESWKAGKVYTKGALVRHAGTFWQAAEDVPAVDGSEPGKDGRWLKVSAISYSLSDLNECARLVLMDKQKSEFIAKYLASRLGQQRGWNEQEVAGAAADVQTALGRFAEELAKVK
jgi:hypothetical protein